MNKYRVLVEGVNFLIQIDDEVCKYGFFTNRYVEAWDKEEAENKAINLIRNELRQAVKNDKSDPPMMFVEEIHELKEFGDRGAGMGFAWYPDKREGH